MQALGERRVLVAVLVRTAGGRRLPVLVLTLGKGGKLYIFDIYPVVTHTLEHRFAKLFFFLRGREEREQRPRGALRRGVGSSTLRGPRAAAGGGLPARLLGKPSGAVFTGGARAPCPPQLRRRGCGTRFGTEPPKRCAPTRAVARLSGPAGTGRGKPTDGRGLCPARRADSMDAARAGASPHALSHALERRHRS